MKKWYYIIDGERKGPFDEEQMKELRNSGVIKQDTPVCIADSNDSEDSSTAGHFAFERICYFIKVFILLIIMGIILFFSIGVFMPTCGTVSEKTRQLCCANNLKQIGLSLRNYAIDYNDFFPPYDGAAGFEVLRKNDYLSDCKSYICHSTKLKPPEPGKPLKEENVSYVYKGGLKDIPENANIPVAWDKDGNHKGCGNVLYSDGRVETAKDTKWNENLKSDKKADK